MSGTFEQISMFELLNPVESRFTYECRRGSGFENGRVRIYCASIHFGLNELARYLKDEYGVGGHSSDYPDGGRGFSDHNGNGITIREWKSNQEEKHSWPEVAKEIKRLIASGKYLDEKDKAKLENVRAKYGEIPVPVPRHII